MILLLGPTKFIILFPIFIQTITPTLILLFVTTSSYFVVTGPWGWGHSGALPYTKHSDAITPACSSMHTYDHAPAKLEWKPIYLTEMSCGDWKFWKIHQECNNGFWLQPHKDSVRRNKMRTFNVAYN